MHLILDRGLQSHGQLIVAELQQYVDDAIKQLNAEGDVSVLIDVGKLIAPIGTMIKVGELLLGLRVVP